MGTRLGRGEVLQRPLSKRQIEISMKSATLVFPHQLSAQSPALDKTRRVVLVEEFLFFKQYQFHKQKLVFHRSSMKQFADALLERGFEVTYVEALKAECDVRKLIPWLSVQGIDEIHYIDVTDVWLEQRLRAAAKKSDVHLKLHPSSLFLLQPSQLEEYFQGRKSYFQTDFYIQQRKRFKILVSPNNQPEGGKWTFDGENRLKYPKGKQPPPLQFPAATQYWQEAKRYVTTNFNHHYGQVSDTFIYPTNVNESRKWLRQFLTKRFSEFGPYEDALVSHESILHHSVLTPMLNVGLLTPQEVIDEAIDYAKSNGVPLNSLEGFVRQIIGWREFIRGVYQYKGIYERTRNFWKFKRKIPKSFWDGTTGIAPVDITIKKVLTTGYCHHIERLMVLGNFMLLCEFDPDEVYRWFMEMFIDSYDWVMVPNVYGMTQFADGGIMSTKPYISGSNYLMKMSDYEKGDWQKVWDGLFWRFMHVHRDFFLQNPRLGMLIKTFDKMEEGKRESHLRVANEFLQRL